MTIQIRVPALGESVTEATVGQWLKKQGDAVAVDEPLVELETEKVTVEVPAPAAGVLDAIEVEKGATVAIGAILGVLSEGAVTDGAANGSRPAKAESPPSRPPEKAAPVPKPPKRQAVEPPPPASTDGSAAVRAEMPPSPSARKRLAEAGLEAEDVKGSGRRGQVLKEDAEAAARKPAKTPDRPAPASETPKPPLRALELRPEPPKPPPVENLRLPSTPRTSGREERVPMSRLRQTIARRLKDAQNTAAMLTTFNDVDMSAVMALRARYKEAFEKRHGVKLGFMGFFVKACVVALSEIPPVNAEIDGGDIVYKNYYHIGVAVGTDKGLVVPVVREADRLSLAEIEIAIADYGARARDGKLGIEDMQGGTFTISNGGVYGSMLSTPILNAPQSGILGMHRIEERAVVRDGQVVARPMMYLALSYDHRLVDGREAVTFLARVKDGLEDPARFMLEV